MMRSTGTSEAQKWWLITIALFVFTVGAFALIFPEPTWFPILLLSHAALAALVWAVAYVRQTHQQDLVQGFCKRLSQANADSSTTDLESMLPPIACDRSWQNSLLGLRDGIINFVDEVQLLQHSQTSSEIRTQQLRERQHQLDQIVTNLSDPVIAVDQFGEMIVANQSAEELFSFKSDRVEQRALNRLLRCEELVDLVTETRKRRTPRVGEIDLTDSAGEHRPFRVACNTLAVNDLEDEEDVGVVAVLNDISSQRQIQKRNAEFVSSVSHEMKTPLAGIKAYVELLVDGDADDEETQEEFLEVINGQADRLQRLIDNLLNLARIEAGVVKVNKEPQSLNSVLEEAWSVVEPAAEQKNIQLTKELSSMYLGVLADHDLLLQAAINLLSNAIKYTEEGGAVTLRSKADATSAIFEVEDSGVGLTEQDCERVFEKFYRVKKNKEMASGTGLGLPLVKHIIEDVHGGTLEVKSELGVGSCFGAKLRISQGN